VHGIISIHVWATAISGLLRSSSVKPTALSIARAGAREGPSTSTLLFDLRELLSSAICNFLPQFVERSPALNQSVEIRLMICTSARARAKWRVWSFAARAISY
jgi:hypothetical protein